MSDYDGSASGPALLPVNGFGGTPSPELYLIYQTARKILQKRRCGFALAGRLLCDFPGNGGVFNHAEHARRQAYCALGRARSHRCAPVVTAHEERGPHELTSTRVPFRPRRDPLQIQCRLNDALVRWPHFTVLFTHRPSIASVLIIRMLLVGYVFALRSERRLCSEVQVNDTK